jgi:hypothetical protein
LHRKRGKRERQSIDRQELSEHFFWVGLLVFSSAAISNWHVLASDLRVVEQNRWWQRSGSLCCRSVFCEIKDKKLICEVEWCLSVMSGCGGAL